VPLAGCDDCVALAEEWKTIDHDGERACEAERCWRERFRDHVSYQHPKH
jgi:hypothetical protein